MNKRIIPSSLSSLLNFFLLLFFIISIYTVVIVDANKMQWHLTNQDENSQHPSPRSVSFLKEINDTHAILFGGYLEIVEDNSLINHGDNQFYNDVYILDTTNPARVNWTRIDNASASIPQGRAYGCVVYSHNFNSLFLYGGITFGKTKTNFTSYSDSWQFDLNTRTWTLLQMNTPPGNLSGIDCDIIRESDTVYLTHGTKNSFNNFQNDTWKWDLATNTWTLLNNASTEIRPSSRAQSVFRRIPNTNEFLFFDGLVLTSTDASKAVHLTDVWRFDVNTLKWTNQTILNAPSSRGNFAYTLTSHRWFFLFGGDISTNKTTSSNCLPPLKCYTSVDPNKEAYFMQILPANLAIVAWTGKLDFDFSLPSNRHASIAVFPPNLYLVGGMDWSGKNGVGEEYNYYTWTINLFNYYFH